MRHGCNFATVFFSGEIVRGQRLPLNGQFSFKGQRNVAICVSVWQFGLVLGDREWMLE
jgi:hypothetical protein